MDPLSVIGSIAGIIAVAAQTVALINIATEELGSRPATLLLLSSETSVFCSVLGHVERSLKAHGSTANNTIHADLSLPISSCMEIFKKISILLADLQPRKSPLKKAALAILWHNKMKEMTQMRDDLERHKMTLLLALQSLQSEESYLSDKRQSAAMVELQKAVEELKSALASSSASQSNSKRLDTVTGAFPKAGADSTQSASSSTTAVTENSNSQDESITQTHKTFDGWLSSFSNPSNSSTADDASLEEFRRRKDRSSAVAEQHVDNAPPASPSPLVEEVSNISLRDSIGYSIEGSEVLENGSVRLVFCDLEKPDSSERFTESIEAEPNECLYSIVLRLFEEGYHRICGFQDFERREDVFPPIVPFDEPFYPAITAGDSCYNIDSGLKINQHQRLIDYFNEFLRINNPAEPTLEPRLNYGDRISIADPIRRCNITVSFRRTLRIPEDGKTYPLPACFDSFQLLKVDDFVNKLPTDMVMKGGMLFPMFQREALAVAFDATVPKRFKKDENDQLLHDVEESFAVKLYAGSINCVSGKAFDDCSADDQDYIVCPQQIRLDGFSTSTGEVKQFVAMPLGWGYSVEKQITGSEFIAGLQLQVARRLSDDVEFEGPFNAPNTRAAEKLDLFQSPGQLGMAAGQILRMRDLTTVASVAKFDLSDIKRQASRFPQFIALSESKCRPIFVSDIIQRNSSESGNMRRFILRPVTPLRVRMDWTSMNIPRGNAWEEFSPFLDVSDFKKYISDTMRREQTSRKTGCLYFNDTVHRGYPEEYISIKALGLADGVVYLKVEGVYSELDADLVGGGGRSVGKPKLADVTAAGWEMCVGVGGKLKQHIYRTVDKRLWDWKNACFLNIQLLNSVAFQSVAGVSPWSPITFKQYVEKAIPFYSFIPGDAATLEREDIGFRSIGELQQSQGGTRIGLRMNEKGAVGCANCEVNLCDTLLVPCNHVWCSDCIRTEMLRAGRTTCLYCQVVSERVVQFSAPAELPQAAAPPVRSPSTSESITLQNEAVVEEVRSLIAKLRLVLPFRFERIKSPTENDEALKPITGVADCIMWDDGNEVEFNIIFALVKNTTDATRILVVRALLKLVRKRYYMERLLTLVSSVEELGKKHLNHLLEGNDYRSGGCLPAILDWTVGLSLSFSDLGVSATSLLSVESADTLDHVISYLTSSGKSIPKDYGVSIVDAMRTTRTGMVVTTVRALASQGCDMNALDDEGKNILYHFKNKVVSYGLMDIGVRADILDHAGNAPVHHAILEAQTFMLEALMAHPSGKQTVDMCNGQGLTPYQLSLRLRVTMLRDILVHSGADVNRPITHKAFQDELKMLAQKEEGKERGRNEGWLQAVRSVLEIGSED